MCVYIVYSRYYGYVHFIEVRVWLCLVCLLCAAEDTYLMASSGSLEGSSEMLVLAHNLASFLDASGSF